MGIVELNEQAGIITIYSRLFFYGDAATDDVSVKVANDIEACWNAPEAMVVIDQQTFLVRFKMEGIFHPNLEPVEVYTNDDPANNYFRIDENTHQDVSFVDGIGSNTGCFKLANLLQTGSTAAHEYGHTIGLDHPRNMDIRGLGIPGIMYPRGTITDAEYLYNPLAIAGDNTNGGTMNPMHRQVVLQDIEALRLHRLSFRHSSRAVLGDFTSIYHYNQNSEFGFA